MKTNKGHEAQGSGFDSGATGHELQGRVKATDKKHAQIVTLEGVGNLNGKDLANALKFALDKLYGDGELDFILTQKPHVQEAPKK